MSSEDPTPVDISVPEVAPAKKSSKGARKLTSDDIEKRKNAEIDVIEARNAAKERYASLRAKEREFGIIEKARFNHINTALGRKATSGEAQNFVVDKPLEPNALDEYQAQKMRQRASVRNQRAFAPVQKL